MASTPVITHIEDLRELAKRKVPRMFYDYADSGSWTESTYRANESDFAKIKLRQRVAVAEADRLNLARVRGRFRRKNGALSRAIGDSRICRQHVRGGKFEHDSVLDPKLVEFEQSHFRRRTTPELPGTPLASGIELNVYPISASYMVGVNLQFK